MLLASSLPSFAACAPRDIIVSTLKERHQEQVVGLGTTHDGLGLVELFRSPAGTFTVTITAKNMLTCILVAGENWQGPLPDDAASTEGEM